MSGYFTGLVLLIWGVDILCIRYIHIRMGEVIASMTKINRNGPVERPCLVEKMEALTSLPVPNSNGCGDISYPYKSSVFPLEN